MIRAHEFAATISPAAAAATPWQAVIVGAGPAGSAVAIRLARAGWRVLLVERSDMPRPKVCGCCLSPQARAELRALMPAQAGRSILGEVSLDRVRVLAAGRTVLLPLPGGGVIAREALDTGLVQEAIDAGASWLPRADVRSVVDSGAATPALHVGCRVADAAAGPLELVASVVVVAAGLVDHVRVARESPGRHVRPQSRVGIGGVMPPDALDLPWGELVMIVGRSGYCGIVRLDDGRIDVAAAVDRRALASAGSPHAAILTILDEAAAARHGVALPEALLEAADFRATPALSHAAPLVSGSARRIFRVGDAAGYVEPFTGEGMGWAMTSGRLLAAALLGGVEPAAAYERSHAACFQRLHGRCRRIAAALRRPRVVGSAIRAAAAAPWAARRLVPLLVGTAPGSEGGR